MGNAASSTYFSTLYESWTNPDVVPKLNEKSKFDANFGFSNPREERPALKYTEEDYYRAKIPANKRDYCADHLIDLARCRKTNYPFLGKCEHYKHDWDHCQNEDAIYRMKEFERDRRLLRREQRKKAATQDVVYE